MPLLHFIVRGPFVGLGLISKHSRMSVDKSNLVVFLWPWQHSVQVDSSFCHVTTAVIAVCYILCGGFHTIQHEAYAHDNCSFHKLYFNLDYVNLCAKVSLIIQTTKCFLFKSS